MHIRYGDIATWFASVGTVGTLLFTLIGITNERKRRRKYEREEQASHISAWVAKELEGQAWIAALNQSKHPIYEVILSIVSFNDVDSASGKFTPRAYRDYLSVVPPGKHYGNVGDDQSGMGFHPTVEIAFKDILGNYWLRKGDGTLTEISVPPMDYYQLAPPLNWQLPEQQLPLE